MAQASIVVLISGSGSNLQALIDAVEDTTIDGTIRAVVSNRTEAFGLQRAARHGIDAHAIDHRRWPERELYDAELARVIDAYQPQVVALAGFMRILTPPFVEHYRGRLLNVHPSLLPELPGLDTHQRAIEAGLSRHGASIHFVTETLDGGPVIVQGRVPVQADDTPETLQNRVHIVEHRIYPAAVSWLAAGRLDLVDGEVSLDGKLLSSPVILQ